MILVVSMSVSHSVVQAVMHLCFTACMLCIVIGQTINHISCQSTSLQLSLSCRSFRERLSRRSGNSSPGEVWQLLFPRTSIQIRCWNTIYIVLNIYVEKMFLLQTCRYCEAGLLLPCLLRNAQWVAGDSVFCKMIWMTILTDVNFLQVQWDGKWVVTAQYLPQSLLCQISSVLLPANMASSSVYVFLMDKLLALQNWLRMQP